MLLCLANLWIYIQLFMSSFNMPYVLLKRRTNILFSIQVTVLTNLKFQ